MRRILIMAALLAACACKDEDANRPTPKPDAGASTTVDAGHKTSDAGTSTSGLEKPGSLARPPSGLPAELRPPR